MRSRAARHKNSALPRRQRAVPRQCLHRRLQCAMIEPVILRGNTHFMERRIRDLQEKPGPRCSTP